MSIAFPISINEKDQTFLLSISNETFDTVQIIFFSADEFILKNDLLSATGHQFDEIVSFRDNHLIEYSGDLSVNMRELDLLRCLVSHGPWYYHQPQGDFRTIDDVLLAHRTKIKNDLARDFIRMNEIFSWDHM